MNAPLTGYTHDGLTFTVRDWGPPDGRSLIALHGFPQTASSWSRVASRLAREDVRVLAPDQRGYTPGAQPSEVSAYTMDKLAGDVLALADAAGWSRFDVLGHDWGGAVAWYLASRHSDRIRTVSVASTPHPRALWEAFKGPQGLKSWYMWTFQLPWLPETLLGARGGLLATKMFGLSGAERPEEMGRLLSDRATATGTLNWYRTMRIKGAATAGRVNVPSLYVWSDRDAALGRQAAERTRDYVDGEYTFLVLDGVSHWIPEESPAELAEAVLAHLDRYPDR
ncbi:MAG: alpha/beta fold hydrolase [Microlunatus sp.]|nr:alpha/beta fold hydrolase [Microlunatus sp.]MDN5771916.1 alpha/beta fold hydrolase [Microlunatus sp.]